MVRENCYADAQVWDRTTFFLGSLLNKTCLPKSTHFCLCCRWQVNCHPLPRLRTSLRFHDLPTLQCTRSLHLLNDQDILCIVTMKRFRQLGTNLPGDTTTIYRAHASADFTCVFSKPCDDPLSMRICSYFGRKYFQSCQTDPKRR